MFESLSMPLPKGEETLKHFTDIYDIPYSIVTSLYTSVKYLLYYSSITAFTESLYFTTKSFRVAVKQTHHVEAAGTGQLHHFSNG